jgi:hypothetical protein
MLIPMLPAKFNGSSDGARDRISDAARFGAISQAGKHDDEFIPSDSSDRIRRTHLAKDTPRHPQAQS